MVLCDIMEEQIVNEIKRLKEELYQQKEAVNDIGQLVKETIDKDYHTDLWELSNRELDNEMGSRLSFMNDDIDTKPSIDSLTSHRRFFGRIVLFFKRRFMKMIRFYTDTLTEKQVAFNSQLVAFHLASFIRMRRTEEKMGAIEQRLKTLEEENEMLRDELEQLKGER